MKAIIVSMEIFTYIHNKDISGVRYLMMK